jgi:perosamine synthetase
MQGNEKEYLIECIETGWISSEGPFVREFEEKMAARFNRRHAVAVSSGTAALDCALTSLRLKKGDEVIIPSLTIISCATAVLNAGAIPVPVDVDPKTWNMTDREVRSKISPRTKAIMVVHTYGLPVEMNPILQIAKEHGLHLVEDAAEAIGLNCHARPCGSFGTLSTFSFYPNKHITTGEGGMVLTDDDELAERNRSLRNLCFQSNKRFYHEEIGWNYRMTNLQAALGLAQLETLGKALKRKREIGHLYQNELRDCPGIQLPVPKTNFSENLYWVFGIVLKNEEETLRITRDLASARIGTRPFFWPMHEQPVFHQMGLFKNLSLPVSERLARTGFYLPSGLGTSNEQIKQVAYTLKALLQ